MSYTPENRNLIETTANDPANYKGKDKYGNEWYSRMENDDSQVWGTTRAGRIQNAGKNSTPGEWDPETGYSRNPKKNSNYGDMMKRKYLHIAMFRAMDCRYDELENPPEILSVFLSDANTYVRADHKTADPAVQNDFD